MLQRGGGSSLPRLDPGGRDKRIDVGLVDPNLAPPPGRSEPEVRKRPLLTPLVDEARRHSEPVGRLLDAQPLVCRRHVDAPKFLRSEPTRNNSSTPMTRLSPPSCVGPLSRASGPFNLVDSLSERPAGRAEPTDGRPRPDHRGRTGTAFGRRAANRPRCADCRPLALTPHRRRGPRTASTQVAASGRTHSQRRRGCSRAGVPS